MTVKNYSQQGGNKWVVSGILEIRADGEFILNGIPISRMTNQPKSVATTIADLKSDFNNLLHKLQTAGLMHND
jgi:hypothetical protein